MRIWTVHLPRAAEDAAPAPAAPAPVAPSPAAPLPAAPLLVREGFSWGAFFLSLPWLLWHRLWLEAIAYLGLVLLLAAFAPKEAGFPVALALQFLLGAHAQDLRRAALARRGRPAAHVVAAPDQDIALARLLEARPELARAALA